MPLNPQALTSLSNFKNDLGITGTSEDTKLQNIINRTTGWIEGKTGRLLKARNYNGAGTAFGSVTSEDYLYFDGDPANRNECGYGVLYVPQFPIVKQSVSGALAVELSALSTRAAGADGAGDTWDTTSLLEGRDYVIDYPNGVITLLGGVFSFGLKNYRLKCTAGFVTIPDDLEQLCIELGKSMYKSDQAVTSESIGTWSRSFSEKLKTEDPFVRDTLGKYTRFAL